MKNKIVYVNVGDLNIDPDYQRGINKSLVGRISKDFNMKYFGVLMVSRRRDGSLYVIDGQHRLEAARIAGVDTVPVSMDDIWDKKKEAVDYTNMNSNRKSLTSVEKFISAVEGCLQPETDINEFLLSIDLHVTKGSSGSKNKKGVSNVSSIKRQWLLDKDNTKKAVLFCVNVESLSISPKSIHAKMIDGAFRLLQNGIDVSSYAEKIATMGGRSVFLQNVSIECNYTQGGGATRANALALLNMINHRKKNKIKVSL